MLKLFWIEKRKDVIIKLSLMQDVSYQIDEEGIW